jgi:hypothetical protein
MKNYNPFRYFKTSPEIILLAVRLEDIKEKPKETMRRLCLYLGIDNASSLYHSTMQGLKWWGDPSSSLYGRTHDTESWQDDPIRIKTGALFSVADQFILQTLFYPLSARFGYVECDDSLFRKDLKRLRILLDEPMDFENKLAKKFLPSYPDLKKSEHFKSLHAKLISIWSVLNEYGTYPNMLEVLPEK